MTRVVGSALTPETAIERLGAMSEEVHTAVLLDEDGVLAAHAAHDETPPDRLRELASDLFAAADAAGARAGVAPVGRLEVSRPDGDVFGLRDRDRRGDAWTLVAVTSGGALSSLVLYDMRMTVRAMGGDR